MGETPQAASIEPSLTKIRHKLRALAPFDQTKFVSSKQHPHSGTIARQFGHMAKVNTIPNRGYQWVGLLKPLRLSHR